jgi:hypothetical protein
VPLLRLKQQRTQLETGGWTPLLARNLRAGGREGTKRRVLLQIAYMQPTISPMARHDMTEVSS